MLFKITARYEDVVVLQKPALLLCIKLCVIKLSFSFDSNLILSPSAPSVWCCWLRRRLFAIDEGCEESDSDLVEEQFSYFVPTVTKLQVRVVPTSSHVHLKAPILCGGCGVNDVTNINVCEHVT